MATIGGSEVAKYKIDCRLMPALWKAQRAFLNAESLSAAGQFDCAANRYYYSLLHVCRQFLDYKQMATGARWTHGDLISAYLTGYDPSAAVALTRAQAARNQADYQPIPVDKRRIDQFRTEAENVVLHALVRVGAEMETP